MENHFGWISAQSRWLDPVNFARGPARFFDGAPEGSFSLNRLYDKAQEAERLWGVRHDGEWYHVGTPAELRAVEDALHHLAESSGQR